jgi:hypothetical protein
LYAAFRRRLAKDLQQTLPWTLWALEILLFLTAMLVNGTGSFASVVAVTKLDNLSFTAILEQFERLPATSEAALVMAGLSAWLNRRFRELTRKPAETPRAPCPAAACYG